MFANGPFLSINWPRHSVDDTKLHLGMHHMYSQDRLQTQLLYPTPPNLLFVELSPIFVDGRSILPDMFKTFWTFSFLFHTFHLFHQQRLLALSSNVSDSNQANCPITLTYSSFLGILLPNYDMYCLSSSVFGESATLCLFSWGMLPSKRCKRWIECHGVCLSFFFLFFSFFFLFYFLSFSFLKLLTAISWIWSLQFNLFFTYLTFNF